jgi:hypothetical protein
MRASGMFTLSQPGQLEEVLNTAGLHVRRDDEINSPPSSPTPTPRSARSVPPAR